MKVPGQHKRNIMYLNIPPCPGTTAEKQRGTGNGAELLRKYYKEEMFYKAGKNVPWRVSSAASEQ